MPQQGPLQWLDGEGWLVALGGGYVPRGAADAALTYLLSVINLDRPMVVLLADGARSDAEAVLDQFTALGGPGGEAFSLPAMTRDTFFAPGFLELLSEAGLLYLGGENPLPLLLNLHNTSALKRIQESFASLQGLTLVGAGGAAPVLGRFAIGPAPDYLQARGLDFLQNIVIESHFTCTEESIVLRNINQLGPGLLGLGIPDAAALAFGPQGQVETWGVGQITAVVSTAKAADEEDRGNS